MAGLTNEILSFFLLILLNGLFALSEAALMAARKARLQQRLNTGDRRAARALSLAENPNQFLSTVQLGITLVNILLGAIGGTALAGMLGDWLAAFPALAAVSRSLALTLVVILTTFLTIVLGELVPKRLALQKPEQLASLMAGPMAALARLFAPCVWLLGKTTDLLLRLLRVRPVNEPPVTEEELLVQLDQGTQAGVFAETEQDMVEGVFSLSDQRVNALMTPRNQIVWLDVNDTVEEIRRKVREAPYSRFPVGVDSLDNVVGIVRAKELLLSDLQSGEQLRQMARPPLFIPETALGSRALEMFRESKREMMLVVDEFGVVQGLLTLADILEEIVGEFDSEPQATQRQDGSWLLDGRLPNEDFKEIFHLQHLPDEEEYETLGGFIMMYLGRVPQVADTFDWGGLHFEIVDMDGNRVDKVLVTTSAAPSPSGGLS
jgi:putative hemolysin